MKFVFFLLFFIQLCFSERGIFLEGTISIDKRYPNSVVLSLSSLEPVQIYFVGEYKPELVPGYYGENAVFKIASPTVQLRYNKHHYYIVYNGHATEAIKWNKPRVSNCVGLPIHKCETFKANIHAFIPTNKVFPEFNPTHYRPQIPAQKVNQENNKQNNPPNKPIPKQGNMNLPGPIRHQRPSSFKPYNRN
ncbi:hypothetical protein BB559_002881 [Furculomyces boomerangus]|uniref:Uncharacterized protein n=2 Tax=Harpellales TaxID=61421 RepID=A0A2T9YRE2_9FUNG|nr:hypothetical protein BB559_002881 [Furculomyces boomerangus]PWA00927.1 hypothetical protein BB558_003002 [Smittium angustum]